MTDKPEPPPTPSGERTGDRASPKPGVLRPLTDEPVAGERFGDLEILEEVARGGMATVYAAIDRRTGSRVGLKLLLSLPHAEEARSRFRREFRALSRLDHPNILKVHDWGVRGDRPWYSMELLEGHDLRVEADLLAAIPAAERYPRITQIIIGAARALTHIHDRGLVHRDITPGNLFVGVDGRVRLMDFGVVKELGAELTAVGEVLGTIAYMSPEQILGESVDGRADLYSLGAVLYRLLTGTNPFQAHTLHGFLDKHLHSTPRPPREVAPDVPPELEQICLRLLRKAPDERFGSAWHLLHALGDDASDEEALAERAAGPASERWPPRTVGRAAAKVTLREAVSEAGAGLRGRALLLNGPVGIGKTRLLELGVHWAKSHGVRVVRARCHQGDRPFGAFATLYDELVDAADASSDPRFAELGRSGSRSNTHPVARAMGDWGGADARPGGATREERYPVLAAFKDLVVSAAPLVIALDDLQDADPATVELLQFLIRNTLELAREPVVFVLAHDDSASARGALAAVESLPSVEVLPLGPLSPIEVEELVVSVLGQSDASAALARRLGAESGGSPAFLADMLRGMLDDGLIVPGGTAGYRLVLDAAEVTRSRLPMPASLRQALRERLEPLSALALRVGRVVAISRRRLDFETLQQIVADVDEDALSETLDLLVGAAIVVEERTPDRDLYSLSHARFREVLVEGLGSAELARAHQQHGEVLERLFRYDPGLVIEELAWHFEQAGLASKAFAWLIRTANRHLQRSLYEESLGFLARALDLEPAARPMLLLDDADRSLAEVWLATSQARYALGRPEEALDATRRAEALAVLVRDARLRSRVATELGVQLRQEGRTAEAREKLADAVRCAEEAGDQTLLPTPLYHTGALEWSSGDLPKAEQFWKRALQIATQVGDERSQGQGYNGLAILAICRGQSLDARRHLEQSVRIFERLGMLGPLSIGRGNLVELYLNTGILRKALALAERTLAQACEVGHVQGIALARGWRARCLWTLGRADEGREGNATALAQVRQLDLREDEAFILGNEVLLRRDTGDLDGALSACTELRELLAVHDHEGILPEVLAWEAALLATAGRLGDARDTLAEITPAPDAWPHVAVRAELAIGRAWAALGQRAEAHASLQKALSVAEANGYRLFQLEAHTELAAVADEESQRDRHVRIAKGLAQSLVADLQKPEAERFTARFLGGAAR